MLRGKDIETDIEKMIHSPHGSFKYTSRPNHEDKGTRSQSITLSREKRVSGGSKNLDILRTLIC